MTEDVWRRRERALAAGIILWALSVSTAATVAPAATARFITSTPPAQLAGALLVSIGLCAGIVHFVILAAKRYVDSNSNLDGMGVRHGD